MASLLGLAGCTRGGPRLADAALTLTPVDFARLPGWTADHPGAAMPALLATCARLSALPPDQPLGGAGEAATRGGRAGDWTQPCSDARQVPPNNDTAARAFLERDLQAWRIAQGDRTQALLTGYFEPEVAGARTRSGAYPIPLYGRPPDMVQADLGAFRNGLKGERIAGRVVNGQLVPYYDRAQIDGGALRRRRLEIAWLADPVDAFFLQIQGAGRLSLPDGHIMRLGYAGQNGRAYVAIGKLLAARGDLPAAGVSMLSIRAWLASHPAEATAVMQANPSYVFFRELPGLAADEGPPGTLGVPLTPGRSLAVDRADVPLGAPMWVDSTEPLTDAPFRRLMLAQDTGGAITGPLRADVFYGWGPDAAAQAGRARQAGTLYLLLPKPPA